MLNSTIRPAIVLFALLTVLTGVIYPLMVTGGAQLFFPSAANGSRIMRNGMIIGSSLIGQSFSEPWYFQGRPSATADGPYGGLASGGSNLGPTNPTLENRVRVRIASIRTDDSTSIVPIDLVTTSASGLDPHISIAAALWQAPRIARERAVAESSIVELVRQHAEPRTLLVFGEPRVNVLALNCALDDQHPFRGRP